MRAAILNIQLFLMILVCSCSQKGGSGLVLDSEGTVCPYQGVTVKVGVSGPVSWKAYSDSSRVMIAPSFYTGDCRVSITVPTTAVKREHDLHVWFTSVTDSTVRACYTIRQDAAPYLELERDTVRVEAAGDTFTVALRSNMEWELSNKIIIDSTMTNYIKLDPVGGTGDAVLNIIVPKNPKKRQRMLYPEFRMTEDPGDRVTLTIIQSK